MGHCFQFRLEVVLGPHVSSTFEIQIRKESSRNEKMNEFPHLVLVPGIFRLSTLTTPTEPEVVQLSTGRIRMQ